MASLRKTKIGNFIICFRYQGKQYQRALKTKEPDAAKAARGKVEHTIYRLTNGDLVAPQNVDVGDYIVWGEAAKAKSDFQQDPAPLIPTVAELVDQYLEAQRGLKADSSLLTERCHLNNLKKALGPKAQLPIDHVQDHALDGLLQRRLAEAERATVKKERQTIISLFKWAVRQKILKTSPAAELPTVQSSGNRAQFRTLAEIEEMLARGGLSDEDALEIWGCLFLTQTEIAEILALVKKQAEFDFIHPMFCVAAYTGMRRGEIVTRLRWLDVDFRTKTISAHSKKQSRQEEETSRQIAMHPELESILAAYKTSRPKGQYVICPVETLAPLSPNMAHGHFQRTLEGTCWERALPSGKKKIIIGFHTFRHSFASNLAMQGVDQRIVDRWMGHQTEEMRKRYQHLFPNKLADAIRSLSYNGNGHQQHTSPTCSFAE